MNDHTATLMAFARGHKVPEPSDEALMAALHDGLVVLKICDRVSASAVSRSRTWHITPLGREHLRDHLDTLPPSRPDGTCKRRPAHAGAPAP